MTIAKKSLGQHWLHDNEALEAMCQAGEVESGNTVLEVGPGTGTLTEKLLAHGATVTAVEVDRDLAGALSNKFRGSEENLNIIPQDIREFDLNSLPADYKVVANIPYYLTSNLIRVLSESSNPPAVCVLLMQKEVAERVAAQPGEMSLLSVTAQFYWQVKLGQVVGAELFEPPPKVDSQILILRRRPKPLLTQVDAKNFFHLVKAGFSQRRKTLLNSLSGGLNLERALTSALLEQAKLAGSTRPQNLSLTEWQTLYRVYKNNT